VKLKLCSNSTRRARWDTKLGFHTHSGPLPISLSSVLPAGGIVSCVSLTVVRAYPTVYVEKLDDGGSGEVLIQITFAFIVLNFISPFLHEEIVLYCQIIYMLATHWTSFLVAPSGKIIYDGTNIDLHGCKG